MFAATILVGVAQKIHIPYPIALVLGGTIIGFIPGLPSIQIDPHLIFVVVLPPILYHAAFGISFREFKKNWKEIFSLALGLVAFTTLIIGLLFKWLFPDLSWALAFAFGAIVSPPDAVAATTILKRFAISPRLLSILEGESLINDASAIVLYKLAVVAILSGSFSVSGGAIEFIQEVVGGVIVGLICGFLMQRFSRRYLAPEVGVVFSFTIPYVTYLIADSIGGSGILAVVVNGLIGSNILRLHNSSLRRIIGYPAWDTFIILMNCFVFILIGLQLGTLTATMSTNEILLYTAFAFLIAYMMFVVRMFWVYAKSGVYYVKALSKPNASVICPEIIRDAALIGWSGMRGIVSLAAALGLPYTLPDGMPLQGRNEVIFITFLVILITLLLPGLTLSPLIKWLKIQQPSEHPNSHEIRKKLSEVALEKIQHLQTSQKITKEEYDFLSEYFVLQGRVLEISSSKHKKFKDIESIRLEVIQAQRNQLLKMWENQEIDDRFLNRLEQELDVEETHRSRAELSNSR